MIFTDGIHLISDGSIDELHTFARRIGLKREWFQDKKKNHPHYDLTTENMKNKALKARAKLVNSRQIVKIVKEVLYAND